MITPYRCLRCGTLGMAPSEWFCQDCCPEAPQRIARRIEIREVRRTPIRRAAMLDLLYDELLAMRARKESA